MPVARKIKGRYELRDVLGQGGMGVVYSAFDLRVERLVAVKTLRDTPDPVALDLFQKECHILAQLSHPNLIEIFDLGQFDDEGTQKPYFVMPLLSGATLDVLIRDAGERLSVARTIEIITQTCRGLHSAHEKGLVHRDLKPSNVFVLDDDSVKVIDFGVAHMIESRSTIGRKGTLAYMAPEQIEMKSVSALSDQFALAVVGYQSLTGRRPFEGSSDRELAHAILRQVPVAVSELNPRVSRSVSHVISKAMAKKPFHRFSSVREFSAALQKAMAGETLAMFDPSIVAPRIARARRAFDEGDFPFASEILGELEDEGHIDQSITSLRRQVEEAQRQNTIRALLKSAQTRFQEEEYPLALQKVHEILELDPEQPDALALKLQIESKRTERKVEDWFRLAVRHIEARDFAHACEALHNLLELRPNDSRARNMLADVERQEQEYLKLRKEREALYQAALQAWQSGEITTALGKLERVLEMSGGAYPASDAEACYQDSYNRVRSEHDSVQNGYSEARRYLADGNFNAALALCDQFLSKYPRHTLFQALRIDIEETRRQRVSEEIAEINRRVAAEPDLDRRVSCLQEAADRYPEEQHFQQMLQTMRDRRELVNSIVARARMHEEHRQFADALGQWEILQSIHPQYPGIEFEFERVRRRRDQQSRSEVKARWVEQIDRELEAGRIEPAMKSLGEAMAEFPQDPELMHLEKLAAARKESAAEARALLDQGRTLCLDGRCEEGIALLRNAVDRSPRDGEIRAVLIEWLIRRGYDELPSDLAAAESLAQEALQLESNHAPARSLLTLARDRQAEQFVSDIVMRARELHGAGRLRDALRLIGEGLERYPDDGRLRHLREVLAKAWEESRQRDLEEARRLEREALRATDPAVRDALLEQARALTSRHAAEESPDAEAPERRRLYSAAYDRSEQASELIAPALRRDAPARRGRVDPVRERMIPVLAFSRRALSSRWIWATPGVIAMIALLALSIRDRQQSEEPPPVTRARAEAVTPPETNAEREVIPAAVTAPFQLLTDAGSAEAFIDGQSAGFFTNGQLELKPLASGPHTITVKSPRGEAQFVLPERGSNEQDAQAVSRGALVAFLVAARTGETRVISSVRNMPVAVDGVRTAVTGPEGLRLPQLEPGSHRITVGQPESRSTFSFHVADQPALTAFVHSPRPTGSLVVATGQDGVSVSLNGRPVNGVTQNGELRFDSLVAREYVVEVSRSGFEPLPPQRIRVSEGRQATVQFQMKLSPASLELAGAPAGAAVFLDSKPVGAVRADGAFSLSGIEPGNHVLELRRDQMSPKQAPLQFFAGQTVRLGPDATAMTPVEQAATVRFRLKPQTTTVRLMKPNEQPQTINPSAPLSLPKGEYVFSAQANGFEPYTERVKLSPGEAKELAISLKPKVEPLQQVRGASAWEKPERWTREGDVDIVQGGDIVLLRRESTPASITFAAQMKKGKRLQWVLNYQDGRNYTLFRLDKKNFYRLEVTDGKTKEVAKIAHGDDMDDGFIVQIAIQPHSIVHRLYVGNRWETIDHWAESGRSLSAGRFGLLVPGNDRVALSRLELQL